METKKQVINESRMMERMKSALMREIRAGAKEIWLFNEMMTMRQEKDSRIEEDRLLKEATGRDSATETFDKTKVTKISWEDDEVMVLYLRKKRLGPVWRQI